jgi:ArsR family transcriptional regulator, virulence genes transcriptional regulator
MLKQHLQMNSSSTYSMTLNSASTNDSAAVKVDFLTLKKAAMILRAMNHKLRQQIIKLIDDNKRITVTEIYVKLRLEQSVASQHLAILRRAGIVKTTRDGKFIYYTVNVDKVKQIMDFVEDLTAQPTNPVFLLSFFQPPAFFLNSIPCNFAVRQ